MTDTNKSKKKLILWTILFAPYGAYLMFKQKEYKMLGVVFLLGIISLVFFEPPKKPQLTSAPRKASPPIPMEDIYAQAQSLLSKGMKMKGLRHTEDLNKLAECGKQMRANQGKVKELRSAIDVHEHTPKRLYLGTALINLSLCVSCSKTLADQSCEQAQDAISQYNKL